MLKIWVCLKAKNNPFRSYDIQRSIEDFCYTHSNIGAIIRMPDTIKDNKQENIIQEFINQQVDAIIWSPSDPHAHHIKNNIQKHNIPLLIIDSNLIDSDGYSTLLFNNYDAGKKTAELLLKKLWSNDEIAIIVWYEEGSYTAREYGLIEHISNNIRINTIQYAHFQEDEAYEKTKNIIEQYPNIKAIFCTSDNMALGCKSYLNSIGKTNIMVCSCDGTYTGRRAVETGQLMSTIDVNPSYMGRRAMELIQNIITTKQEYHECYDIIMITSQNATHTPKSIIHKRHYEIINSDNNFNYNSLHNSETCPIIIWDNMIKDIPQLLQYLWWDKYIIITDDIVNWLYGNKLLWVCKWNNLDTHLIYFPHGEKNKTFSTLELLIHQCLDLNITKKSIIVSLWWWIVGNIAWLTANMLMRWIRFVHIPSTVMHQVDASTGWKQAVNTHHGKNIIWSFYEPEFIYNDTSCINTLPLREYNNGLAEIIKHGLCESPHLLSLLERNESYEQILIETLQHKIKIMEEDPRELNKWFILIYGHTLGHAIEILSNGTLLHGEAIAIGMTLEAKISHALWYCSENLIQYHQKLFQHYKLPTNIPYSIDKKLILKKLSYDKKERKKHITFALLRDIGQMVSINWSYSIDVPMDIIEKVIYKS